MTQAQKVIKYVAIAFAALLIVGIAAGIFKAVLLFGGVAGIAGSDEPAVLDEATGWTFASGIESLKIDVSAVDLTIQEGDAFAVETTGRYITCEQKGDTLVVRETRHNWFSTSRVGTLTVTLPTDTWLKTAEITTGAGVVEVAALRADTLELELGAGEVMLRGLDIDRRVDIDGGAGKITVQDSRLTALDLDMGVGELNLTAEIGGESDIDLGVGAAYVTLVGGESDYRVRMDKGLGSATLNGVDMHDDMTYGNGATLLELDGGVGDVAVRFAE